MQKIKANKPSPIISEIDVVAYKKNDNPKHAVDDLLEGYNIIILDFYSTGMSILNELKKYLRKKYKDTSFNNERSFRNEFHKLSNQIFLEIRNNKLVVKKSPKIGWFNILYSDLDAFLLSFPKIQGLNSSWQWYKNGIEIPSLKNKIHPWYGTYFPTRFEHLLLFNNWLSRYSGKTDEAFDIGIGSGVLTMQMLQAGIKKVYGTDINPNVIIGIDEYVSKNKLQNSIKLGYGNLFANFKNKADLIVFNPPWIPSCGYSEGIDKAIYYDEALFPFFFNEASNHLNKDGNIVLLFSNIAELTNEKFEHPIKKELKEGGRFQKVLFEQKKVKSASKKTKRNISTRKNEFVELWVLSLK